MAYQFNGTKNEFYSFRFIKNALETIDKIGLKLSPQKRQDRLKRYSFQDYVIDFLANKDYGQKNLLEKTLNRLQTEILKIELGGESKKERMIITSDERGVFSFGLASKGLIKPIEYFSNELAIDSPKEFPKLPSGVVPADDVKRVDIGKQKQFWYHSPTTNKDYQMTQQQEGTREVDLGLKQKKVFKTTNKKSYVLLPKKSGKPKMIDVFIPLHKGVSLFNIIPLYLATINLEKQGIRVKVTSVRMVEAKYNTATACAIGVKDYTEPLDIYQVARKTDSGEWWSCMYGILSFIEDTGMSGGSPNNEEEYIDLFKRWKNWHLDQVKKGKADPLRITPEQMIFGYTPDTSDEGMLKGYFKIMDIAEFQFKKEEYCLERIYKRLVENELAKFIKNDLKKRNLNPQDFSKQKKDKKQILIREFRQYCTQIWLECYHSAEVGQWCDSDEEKQRLTDARGEKLDKLVKFLKTKS